MEKEVLILIPARYASTRFPGKPLARISGVSMVERVVRNCQKTGFDCCVVTDSHEIEMHVKEFGDVCRVDDDVSSGSERIALAFKRFFRDKGRKYRYIINVQGDEPLINSTLLQELALFHQESNYDITTVIKRVPFDEYGRDDFNDANRVKVIWSKQSGRCHYFSRAPIPFDRSQKVEDWFLHIGIYSYKVESLFKFLELESSYYDRTEQLEQLRAIENDMKIGAIETRHRLVGVDCLEDIERVEGVLRG